MSDSKREDLCRRVDDAMAELLDGSADDALYDHLADCDRCRDARHDAERAAEVAADAGADYEHPEDFDDRVAGAIDGADEAEPSPAEAPSAAEGDAEGDLEPAEQPADEEPVARTKPSATELMDPDEAPVGAEAGEVVARTVIESEPETPDKRSEGARSTEAEVVPLMTRLRKPRNTVIVGILGAALAAASVALLVRSDDPGESDEVAGADKPWTGKVGKVSRAAGGEGGLSICNSSGDDCEPASASSTIAAGKMLKTDDRTRAYVVLGDGTRLVLDRSTELKLAADSDRTATLNKGAIVAEVAKLEGSSARIKLRKGRVDVLGTKFALRTSAEGAAVDVSRGVVRLVDDQDRSVDVRAGEEGRMYSGVAPYAMAAPSLGESLSWSEETEEEEVAVRGLGELKAKKPGSDEERQGAVRLTSHKVKVRVVDGFARTEVEEVFSNTTDEVLEGIYRFPLPPDAQVERLALEVDGHMEEGAFVDRDRAAAIWRGAIVNAAARKPQPREEIIWVPGPWKDPALLEWQRGGRFELRIFPIPRKGSRKIVLTYTQTVAPSGGVRRYIYPLAHDPSGSLRVDDFEVDVQLRGHDRAFGVASQGYALTRGAEGNADTLAMSAKDFVPSGDLVVEYATENRDSELSAWAYRGATVGGSDADAGAAKSKNGVDADDNAEALAIVNDDRPYLAMTLRPKLPRWRDDAQRAYVVVVDTSRSMFGERYRRAAKLAGRLVGELDRLDVFTVLACDTSCRAMGGGLQAPSNASASATQQFLDGLSPEGGSDPAASLREAGAFAGQSDGRALRVVYIGDGTPTVGPIRPAYLTAAARDAVPASRGTVTTVAIGADADIDALAAMSRGGGGTMLPYVPGQSTPEAAYAVLGATYGTALRELSVELPSGLVEVAPRQLDTIPAGGEALLVARMTQPTIRGTVVLRGKVGDEVFEQRYPLDVVASGDPGNAFVPRLYAGARITDLEREGTAGARGKAVALSGAFNVASRYTSLLVLESPAMFRAFGLDNTRRVAEWTGESEASSVEAQGELAMADKDMLDDLGPMGGGGEAKKSKADWGRSAYEADDLGGGWAGPPPPASMPAKPRPMATTAAPPAAKAPPQPARDRASRRPPRPRGGWVAMRKVWSRQATIDTNRTVPRAATAEAIAKAADELTRNENRRALVKELYTLYTQSGDLEQASALAERWSAKEALDPEALTARADVAAMRGNRDQAIRILGSVVDVRPGDVTSQQRLARLHRWAGRSAVGCRHSIAIAQLREKDAKLLAEAVDCGRKTGETRMVQDMLASAEDKVRSQADALLAKMKDETAKLRGELQISATWEGGQHDLDLGLIHPEGLRVSWLGAPTKALISAEDVTSKSREGLALLGTKAGEYVVEVVRASGEGPVRGELTIKAPGGVRKIPFTLQGERLALGTVRVFWKSDLVPVGGGSPWGGGLRR